ncbi:unnamed protein product [Kuraishia capsulata CBS 1993]|uniref:Glycosyltransferase family 32 protein n=1 Tax=Kuraishia capsulata CBS 1993 TaxID=1382522 RepID=W6MU94_9ASCO|nr:uncharacterized protein KUCA_T00004988001 [Kuraishia capsulata CBS 1993]CDK29002.1 unnamed protein product [Kuraishia capsulata CBS 1993]
MDFRRRYFRRLVLLLTALALVVAGSRLSSLFAREGLVHPIDYLEPALSLQNPELNNGSLQLTVWENIARLTITQSIFRQSKAAERRKKLLGPSKLPRPDPYNEETTYQRLLYQFPYDSMDKRPIERNIWQMWKTTLANEDIPYRSFINDWKNLNPNDNYNLISDKEVYEKIKLHLFRTVPEVVQAFDMMPEPILQHDLGRYLIVFLKGGVYSDIDTQITRPIDEWYGTDDPNVGFIVGVEEDMNLEDWFRYMPRRLQFAQWTLRAKSHHPLLARLIARIVKTTFDAKKKDKLRAYYESFTGVDKCESIDVMDWTGPGVFTDVVMYYLNIREDVPQMLELNPDRENQGALVGPKTVPGQMFDYKLFSGLMAPVVIGDLIVYPKRAWRFSPDGMYGYSIHHFGGTWKANGES